MNEPIRIEYINHRKVFSQRFVSPISIEYKNTEYCSTQWILKAFCHTRKAERDFAIKNILNFKLDELQKKIRGKK